MFKALSAMFGFGTSLLHPTVKMDDSRSEKERDRVRERNLR